MGHTDVVTIDPKKWIDHGPFSADSRGGYVYGRGTVDDKDNLVASLMLVLMLKRSNAALDRDVIFLAESGEEGTPEVGAQLHDRPALRRDRRRVLPRRRRRRRAHRRQVHAAEHQHDREGAARRRDHRARAGRPRLGAAPDQRRRAPLERGRQDRRRGRRRCASTRRPASYFRKLAAIASPEAAKRYRDVLSPDPKVSKPAADWMLENEPEHWSMLHTSLVPTILTRGYRYNVIPSEAKATLDVRLHPDEDQIEVPRSDPRGDQRSERRGPLGARSLSSGRRVAH